MKTIFKNTFKTTKFIILSIIFIVACSAACCVNYFINAKTETVASAADSYDTALMNEWNSKVEASTSARPQTFKLTKNWVAAQSGFGTGTGFEEGHSRSLLVPSYKNIILDLNGYKLDRNLSTYIDWGCVITVKGTLTIKDSSSSKTGVICGGYNGNYGGAIVVDGGKFTLESGKIADNVCKYYGGAVYLVNTNATFIMNGGTISDNLCGYETSNGVYVGDKGTFLMNGGALYGGVKVSENGTFSHDGGTVNDKNPPKTLTDTTRDVRVIYDGQKHYITVSATGFYPDDYLSTKATIRFGVSADNCNLTACPTVTNVSESTTIYYKVTFKDTYKDFTGSAKITVTPRSLAANTEFSTIADRTYTGTEIVPEFTVSNSALTIADKTLVNGTDFTAEFSDNINAGTATITLTGKGNFTGTCIKTFNIVKAAVTDATADVNVVYDRAPHGITVSVTGCIGDDTFENSSAVVRYGISSGAFTLDESPVLTDAGSPLTIYYQITFANYNTVTGSKTVTITSRDLSGSVISVSGEYVYIGSEITPEYTAADAELKGENKSLMLGTDYTAVITDNLNAGTATITLTGTGNFSSVKSQTFEIKKAILTDVSEGVNVIYDGLAHQITVNATGFMGEDGMKDGSILYCLTEDGTFVAELPSVTNVSDSKEIYYKVTFDNYEMLQGSRIVTVTPRDISAGTVIKVTGSYEYNGAAIIPNYTVENEGILAADKSLKEDVDFIAGYSDNVNVGTAKIKLKGTGNFTGEATQTFEIKSDSDTPVDPEEPDKPEPPKEEDKDDSGAENEGTFNPAVVIVPVAVVVVGAGCAATGIIIKKRRK